MPAFARDEALHSNHANPVAIANHAGNGISKNARGAPAFLVFVKPLQKWLLLCCASEVWPLFDTNTLSQD